MCSPALLVGTFALQVTRNQLRPPTSVGRKRNIGTKSSSLGAGFTFGFGFETGFLTTGAGTGAGSIIGAGATGTGWVTGCD